ncbi:MAG: four helix bundle protein [Planctomycetaceae bacterium]
MRDHTKFRAFELADEVALLTYRFTSGFPREEQFGLTSRMRRAAVSVPSNIVEGCGRIQMRTFCVSSTWPRSQASGTRSQTSGARLQGPGVRLQTFSTSCCLRSSRPSQ